MPGWCGKFALFFISWIWSVEENISIAFLLKKKGTGHLSAYLKTKAPPKFGCSGIFVSR